MVSANEIQNPVFIIKVRRTYSHANDGRAAEADRRAGADTDPRAGADAQRGRGAD